jgi:hypothetical protein
VAELNIYYFNLRVRNMSQVGILDEIHHLIQNGIDSLPIIGDRADPQDRLLPQILILYLGYGDVEPLPGPLHDTLEHLSFSLQGKIPMEKKLQLAHPNDHDLIPRL